MNKGISYTSIILILIFINIIGITLRYFDLDTYLILFGFRFQLSLFLPIIIILRKIEKEFFLDVFKNPPYKKNTFYIYLLITPLLVILVILFFLKKIELGDPEYFYEFGFSSIADFPVYLVWNSLQLISFFLFLIYLSSFSKFRFSFNVLIIILLFAYKFIPLGKESINYYSFASFFMAAMITGILIKYFQNIYWLTVFSFSVLWINFLLFGSESEIIIHLLFASQYNAWEGFFTVSKNFNTFLLPAHFLLTGIFLLPGLSKKGS